MTRQKESRFRILPLLLIPLGFAVYAGALRAPFAYDDTGYILTNSAVMSLSNFTNLTGTRYVGFLSFALNYRISGFTPFDFHLVNVLIHIANSLLVYFVIRGLFKTPLMRGQLRGADGAERDAHDGGAVGLDSAVAFVASAVFLVHPLNTQAVTYITQRFTSLATLFYLLSVLLFLMARLSIASSTADGKAQPRRIGAWAAYAGSLASAVVAMKTKEISFTLPVVIALIDYIFISSAGDGRDRRTGMWMRAPFYLTLLIIPMSLLGPDILGSEGVGASATLRELQLKEAGTLSRYEYVLTQFRVIMTYIGLFLYPAHQYLDYMYQHSKSILELRTVISLITLSAFLVLSVIYGARSKVRGNTLGVLFASGVVWFFITLSVESFLVPIQDVIFEHRSYLPGIGFMVSAVAIIFMVGGRILAAMPPPRRTAVISIVALALMVPPLSYATVKRNKLWGDEVALITESIERFPNKQRLYLARAQAAVSAGDYERALEDVGVFIEMRPEIASAYSIRGIAIGYLGHHEEAIADFTRAVEIDQTDTMPYYNRGLALKRLGRFEEAITDFGSVLAIRRNSPDALNERGVALAMLGRMGAAVSDFESACRLGYETGCENLRILADADGQDAARESLKGRQ